jgi:UDP-glucuronate 4-epimerase
MILVTGCAGFIGFHLSFALCKAGFSVIGIDNLNDYYSIELKQSRLKILEENFNLNFSFSNIDLRNVSEVKSLLKSYKIDKVYHLAAQAGVRYSLTNPSEYISNNINGFFNLLDSCRIEGINDFIFAGTSGVYGNNSKIPFSELEPAIEPENLYSATKRADELIAYTYAKNFNMNILSLRFFTVFGEYGRPDMGIYIFTNHIENDKPIPLFNGGKHFRSFTYIKDLVSIIMKLQNFQPDKYFEILNLGNPAMHSLDSVISSISKHLKKDFKIQNLDLQKGDILQTQCDFSKVSNFIGEFEFTELDIGISEFVNWYRREGFKYATTK